MNSISNNSVQSRSLWIGEIEYWMDEGFIIKLFDGVGIFSLTFLKQMLKILKQFVIK